MTVYWDGVSGATGYRARLLCARQDASAGSGYRVNAPPQSLRAPKPE
ncbi:MAG: hypothetical protein ACK4P5_06665 [Fimbriimonadales bacterium]